MKEILKKVFSRTILEPIITFIVSVLILQFIVFPGLTINNTLLNLGAGMVGIVLVIFILTYYNNKLKDRFETKEDKPSQEPLKEKEDEKI
jgi:uncharacterized membrane protein